MLATFLDTAMERAVYEIIEDEGTYWGEIPGLQGVWARQATLEGCRRELREALSDWVALRLWMGLPIPVIERLDMSRLFQLQPAGRFQVPSSRFHVKGDADVAMGDSHAKHALSRSEGTPRRQGAPL